MSEIDTPALADDTVLWSSDPEDRAGRPLLVLLHGYGSDEHDLFGLRPYLPADVTVAAVRAPLTPPWPAPGYSWYPIEGLDGRDPSRVTDAARRLIEWVDTLAGDDPVGLLGFSQGAAVSMQALRLEPHRVPRTPLFLGPSLRLEPQRVPGTPGGTGTRCGPAVRDSEERALTVRRTS